MQELDFNELTRRPDEHRSDCWRIYCGDINAGWIGKVATVSAQTEWAWSAGFYPGSSPGEIKGGTTRTIEEAKAAFRIAWSTFSRSRKPEDFEEWRDNRDSTAWKYRMHDLGLPLPTASTTGCSRCFCGAEITMTSVSKHIRAAHRKN